MIVRFLNNTQLSLACFHTGITSIFDVSSHLKTIPSRLAGSMHLDHWHPVGNGSGGGTIISTLSFRCTTPITLTVLPSLMYLSCIITQVIPVASTKVRKFEFLVVSRTDQRGVRRTYPSFKRMTRSSLERFLSASHLTKSGDMSLFDGLISITTDSSTYGVTLAPQPVFTRALSPDWKSEM